MIVNIKTVSCTVWWDFKFMTMSSPNFRSTQQGCKSLNILL